MENTENTEQQGDKNKESDPVKKILETTSEPDGPDTHLGAWMKKVADTFKPEQTIKPENTEANNDAGKVLDAFEKAFKGSPVTTLDPSSPNSTSK